MEKKKGDKKYLAYLIGKTVCSLIGFVCILASLVMEYDNKWLLPVGLFFFALVLFSDRIFKINKDN